MVEMGLDSLLNASSSMRAARRNGSTRTSSRSRGWSCCLGASSSSDCLRSTDLVSCLSLLLPSINSKLFDFFRQQQRLYSRYLLVYYT